MRFFALIEIITFGIYEDIVIIIIIMTSGFLGGAGLFVAGGVAGVAANAVVMGEPGREKENIKEKQRRDDCVNKIEDKMTMILGNLDSYTNKEA